MYMFQNVKSKYRSSKCYSVLLSYYEIFLYLQSHRKIAMMMEDDGGNDDLIQEDEMHWYNHLMQEGDDPVSKFLSEKYIRRQQELEQRRVDRMIKRRKYFYGNLNVGAMKKDDLLYFAKEHDVDIGKLRKKEKIVKYVIEELQKRRKQMSPSELAATGESESIGLYKSMEKINELYDKAAIPGTAKHVEKYPPNQKSWYDLDFRLFDSALARLQQRCNCRSGVQLPGVCKHVGSMLWLTWYSIFSDPDEILQMSKRDKAIFASISDLTAFSQEQKKQRKKAKYWCIVCKTADKEGDGYVHCDKCNKWYHYSCLKTTESDVKKDPYTTSVYFCNLCSAWDVWVVRNT